MLLANQPQYGSRQHNFTSASRRNLHVPSQGISQHRKHNDPALHCENLSINTHCCLPLPEQSVASDLPVRGTANHNSVASMSKEVHHRTENITNHSKKHRGGFSSSDYGDRNSTTSSASDSSSSNSCSSTSYSRRKFLTSSSCMSSSVWVPRCSTAQMLFLLLPPVLLLMMPDLGIASMCIERFSCQTDEQKRVVKCVDPDIDVVPMCLSPSLLQLSLHSTKIHALYLVSLRFYSDLRHVNLSDNEINLIEARSFEYQPNLEELHLADNKLSALEADKFVGLHNLTVLSLQGNLLEEIPDKTFEHLKRLELLDLSRNRLKLIGDSAFYNLGHLRVLRLNDNMLTTIPSAALVNVPHLAELGLGMNSFGSLSSQDLKPLTSLTSLDLSGVYLGDGLKSDSFSSLGGLRLLKLDDCGLKNIPTEALRSLDRLEQLFLNRNMFKELKPGMLDGNRRLQVLEIIGCPNLERISNNAFKNTLDLRRITIARNPKMWYIPPGTFRFLTQIRYLDLHANNLHSLQREVAVWNDIPVWLIQDNPLECNCSVSWLRDELKHSNFSSVPVICAAPPHLEGTPLVHTEDIDLSCGLGPATQGLVIGIVVVVVLTAVVGAIVFLLCRSSKGSCVRHLMPGLFWSGRDPSADIRRFPDYPEYIVASQHKPVPVTEL